MNGNVRGMSGRIDSAESWYEHKEPEEQPEVCEAEHEEHECDQVAGPGRCWQWQW